MRELEGRGRLGQRRQPPEPDILGGLESHAGRQVSPVRRKGKCAYLPGVFEHPVFLACAGIP